MVRSRLSTLVIASALVLTVHCEIQRPQEKSKDEIILAKACQFLWDRQNDDGGWHSEIHGLLKTGQALTPYILFALLDVPDSVYAKDKGRVEKGLAFIRTRINKDGALGMADPDVVEYPDYSTAYALRVLVRYGTAGDSSLVERMKTYLLGQQFTERRGIGPGDPAYGSWGFGETNIGYGKVGHVDLSHTRRVLQALGEAGVTNKDFLEKARRFLRLLQKHPTHPSSPRGRYDGGFYFSPVVLDANKAGREEERNVYRSYASATCDGMLALLASGQTLQDEPVESAARWLDDHHALEYPEGIPENDPDQWRKVLFFYHLSVRAEAWRALGRGGEWRNEMRRIFAEKQTENGSFSNPYGSPNKEDDPLLATAFVVGALENMNAR